MTNTSDSAHIDTSQIVTNQPEADALVLFGATGDLAKRKLFPSLYHLEHSGVLQVPVIGVARSDWSDDEFRAHARESIEQHVDDAEASVIDSLMGRLDLVQGDYADEATWNELVETLDGHGSQTAVFYMAIPPSMFPMVAESLASVGLNQRGRIVVEKPFGRDLESAVELNKTLHSVFAEDHIFRIDHYLGKEAVEDLLVFRFANTLLEPVWNRHYVRSVQVTMSESIGIEGRGNFYEGVGAIRDVLQNHLLQVVALLAMEPRPVPILAFSKTRRQRSSMRCVQSTVHRSCVASTSDIAMRKACPRTPRSRPMPQLAWRSIRGVGLACRGTSESGRGSPSLRPRPSSNSRVRHGCCSTRQAARHRNAT